MKTDIGLLARCLPSDLSEMQRTIQMADTKANIILVLIGVILSLFFNFFVSKNIFPGYQVLVVLALFFISGGFALSTLYPRMPKSSGKFSLIYYRELMNINPDKITKQLVEKNFEEDIIKDYIFNLKALGQIINKKFVRLRWSYIFFGLAVILKVIFEIMVLVF